MQEKNKHLFFQKLPRDSAESQMLCSSHCVHYCAFQVCNFCTIISINILHFLNWLTLPKLRGLDSFLFTCFKNKWTTTTNPNPQTKLLHFLDRIELPQHKPLTTTIAAAASDRWRSLAGPVAHMPVPYSWASVRAIYTDTTLVSLRQLNLHLIPTLRTLNPTFYPSESTCPQRISYSFRIRMHLWEFKSQVSKLYKMEITHTFLLCFIIKVF